MDTTKVFIDDQRDTAGINCPKCHTTTEVSISSLGLKHHLKVKCKCKNVFMVEVEFRDKTRKMVDFPGSYEVAPNEEELEDIRADKKWDEILFGDKEPNCRVIDLSREGIGLLAMDGREIKYGDILELGFRLDNKYRKKVNQTCRVKHVNGAFVGCEMLEENITLSYYLLGRT